MADLLRVRTVLRASLEAIAPLLFGYVSTLFGARTGGLGNPTGDAGPGGSGLDATFLIMLLPLTVAGLLLVLRARSTYPRDVATAAERNTRQHPPHRPPVPSPARTKRPRPPDESGSRSACGQFGAAVSARG